MALSKTNPRARFVASEPERVALEKLCNSDWYIDAVQSALASYIRQGTLDASDQYEASDKFHAIRGAREFAEILLTMADKPKSPDPTENGKLNHNI